jgi:hypothetical protein
MKGLVLRGGKFNSEREVPRGPPVLRTADEWHGRGVRLRREKMPSRLFLSFLVFFPVMFFLMLVVWDIPASFVVPYTFFYWIGYRVMGHFHEIYQSNREVERQNFSGLFEYGVQVRLEETNLFFFVPYAEIINFRVKRGWFGHNLEIKVRDLKKPFVTDDLPEILGVEGLDELRRRIGRGAVEMPRLVLYGERTPATMTGPPFSATESRVPVYSAPLQF